MPHDVVPGVAVSDGAVPVGSVPEGAVQDCVIFDCAGPDLLQERCWPHKSMALMTLCTSAQTCGTAPTPSSPSSRRSCPVPSSARTQGTLRGVGIPQVDLRSRRSAYHGPVPDDDVAPNRVGRDGVSRDVIVRDVASDDVVHDCVVQNGEELDDVIHGVPGNTVLHRTVPDPIVAPQ